MAESVIEKCTELVNNRFKLALLASQRVHDLNTGASSVPIEASRFKSHKNAIVSLYEIAEGKVDTHELFNLLVMRCRGYVKGNIKNDYMNNTNKLEKMVNFSDKKYRGDHNIGHKNIYTENNDKMEFEIKDRDVDEMSNKE